MSDLGDRNAHNQEKQGRVHIRSFGDVETQVGPSQEEAETQSGRQGGEPASEPIARRGDTHDYQDQEQIVAGFRETAPEREQDQGGDQGGHKPRCQQTVVPVKPIQYIHPILVRPRADARKGLLRINLGMDYAFTYQLILKDRSDISPQVDSADLLAAKLGPPVDALGPFHGACGREG